MKVTALSLDLLLPGKIYRNYFKEKKKNLSWQRLVIKAYPHTHPCKCVSKELYTCKSYYWCSQMHEGDSVHPFMLLLLSVKPAPFPG